VAPQGVVEALDEGEHLHLQFVAGGPGPAVDHLFLQGGEEALGLAVSNASPMLPVEATTPLVRRVRPKSIEVY
jgi:hypothetical protein